MAIFTSRIFTFSAVFLFVLEFLPQVLTEKLSSIESRSRLIEDLFIKYNKIVIPTTKEAVPLTLDLSVHAIDLDEKERTFNIHGYLSKSWDDVRLRWDPSAYDNVDKIRIPVKNIWTPDIYLYNYQRLTNPINVDDDVVLYSSGSVTYVQRIADTSVCAPDMSKFPLDTQTCILKYGSWVYSGLELNISTYSRFNIDEYIPNQKWKLVSIEYKIDVKTYPCCPEPYPTFVSTFVVRRNILYVSQLLLFPAIIIGALVPFMFLLPPEAKERITLGIALIVISVIQINVINGSLTKQHEKNPVILTYHMFMLLWVALSVILSIFILNIYNRGPRRKKMHEILRLIFLRGLRKLVCLGDDTYHPTDEQEAMSMRGLGQSNGKDVAVGVQDEKSDGAMDNMEKHMQSLAQRGNILDARHEIFAEWQQMALVIDRIMFILSLLTFVISAICLFA